MRMLPGGVQSPLLKTIMEITCPRGKVLAVSYQVQKSRTQRSPAAVLNSYIKSEHLDRDWKGIWKNQIYGMS